ncbi:hypothetical protein R5R35_011614 [Gryllus longicercus]|uniref:Serpin domain-containing protein n=1 Tax=Gryllus longicercus TaxID=2509291 RepID=A0AAN9VNR5_9ORTH
MVHALSRRTGWLLLVAAVALPALAPGGVAAPQGAGGSSTAGPPAEPSLRDQAVGAIARASNLFARDLYQVLSKQTGNLLVSPLSASAVLALTWLGSARQTAQQLGSALHLPQDYQHVIYGYRALFNSFQARDSRVRLSLANRVFVRRGLGLREDFRRLANETFLAGADEVDFSRPADAAFALNEWVRVNTNGKIEELFSEDQLSESTTLLLANAVYFKGTWQTKFDSTLTSEQPFRTPKAMAAAAAAKAADPAKAGDALRSNARTVALMSVTGDFPYARLPDLEAQALRLPYVGDRVSMLVLLPDAVDGLPRLEAALSKLEVSTLLAQLHVEEVNVWLPRFSLHTTVPLNGALQELGLGGLFNGSADFSGIASSPIFMNEILQKATIEVNEEGTEASAATGGVFFLTAADLYNFFRADHPFMFFLLDDQTGTVLFQGRFVEPE